MAVWAGAVGVLSAFYATVFALTETLTSPVDFLLWAVCNALETGTWKQRHTFFSAACAGHARFSPG